MKIIIIIFGIIQISNALQEVRLLLYNRENPNTYILPENLVKSEDYKKPFKFLIHGFWGNYELDWLRNMKYAYLRKGDYNVIVVGWCDLSGSSWIDYIKVLSNINKVAEQLAYQIWDLKYRGASLKNMHLIGHSLGSHVAGFTGKILAGFGDKIDRITGLDPAGPGFTCVSPRERLDRDDADFVDIFHTSLLMGLKAYIGHVDVVFNGGLLQPGCILDTIWDSIIFGNQLGSCSHNKAHVYFTESINSNDFIATECSSYLGYILGLCNNNSKIIIGENINMYATGVYHIKTNRKPPYAKG